MLLKSTPDHPIASSEITSEAQYEDRRAFLKEAGLLGLGVAGMTLGARRAGAQPPQQGTSIGGAELKPELTPWEDVTGYNNFYEFGTDKDDPARYAGKLKTRPWAVAIEGEVKKPRTLDIEDILRFPLEERIYRLRCVEAWSMVIPWIGFPLAELLKRHAPTSRAKYVVFESILDPDNLRGQRRSIIEWPYREALRIDEAMHPLTLMAVGMYGEVMPNQNGAPIRLVVPWKYGFKSIKSVVKIRLVEEQPTTSWIDQNPEEYGFYANVNPEVDHPRWSQARERRIGESGRRETLMFNGYADEVAELYAGMDLNKYF